MDNLQLNLDRAIQLLKTPANYEDYLSIKIKPLDGECCCFDHWRQTWALFYDFIHPYKSLENGIAVLIEKDHEKYVLEHHESGPEFIAYLTFGTAIVGLITTLLKFRQLENRHFSLKFKLTTRFWINEQNKEKDSIDIDLSLSDDAIKKDIENYIKKSTIQKRKKKTRERH